MYGARCLVYEYQYLLFDIFNFFCVAFMPKIKTSRTVQLESLCDFSEADPPHEVNALES